MNKNNLVYISVNELYPHPDNPRKVLADIEELAESIKAKGVMQNLTVVPREEGGYTVIIGHRRLAASKLAGLDSVPCVIVEMSYKDQLGTMLLENIQRSDLTVIEQAQGFQMMIELGETVDTVAEKTGFSKSTVRRRIEIAKLDQLKLAAAAERKQLTIGELDRISEIEDVKARNKVVESIGTSNFEYALTSAIKEEKVKKALPHAKKALKELGIKALAKGDRYSSKYERLYNKTVNLWEWDVTTPLFSGKVHDDILYLIDADWGKIEFFEKKKKEPPRKKTQAEKDREAYIDEQWKRVKAAAEAAYLNRHAFISRLTLNSKNYEEVVKGAALIGMKAATSYLGIDSTALDEALGVKTNDWKERRQMRIDGVLNTGNHDMPMLIYLMYGDGPTLTYAGGGEKNFPIHVERDILDLLYTWLERLGYEMSEDERKLKDGTHELFIDKDGEGK